MAPNRLLALFEFFYQVFYTETIQLDTWHIARMRFLGSWHFGENSICLQCLVVALSYTHLLFEYINYFLYI